MVIRQDIEIWEIVKGGTKRGRWEKGCVCGDAWGLLDFVVLVCVWVYFFCSGGCYCQGLQEAEVVYSWYSRLVNRWLVCRKEGYVVTGWGRIRREGEDMGRQWMR
jgi:hypothetical protein